MVNGFVWLALLQFVGSSRYAVVQYWYRRPRGGGRGGDVPKSIIADAARIERLN